MNDNKFLSTLSKNLLKNLNDDKFYDIIIEVGSDPYVKFFHAHMVILNCRSTYFQNILLTNEKKNPETLVKINLPNILPEIFQIVLRYIYGGIFPLEGYDASEIINILKVASELNLEELINYLQYYLIENEKNWMEQNFNIVYQTSFEYDCLLNLQTFCTNLASNEPEKIFNSLNFFSIPEKLLVSIIQNNNLQMNEIQVWEHLLRWGFAQNPELSSDPLDLSKDEFDILKNTLQECIPFIRFHNLTSDEFSKKVLPFKRVLPKELYKDLVKYFLSHNNKPNDRPKSRYDEFQDIKLESQMSDELQEDFVTQETKITEMTEDTERIAKLESEMTEVITQLESEMTEEVAQLEPVPTEETTREITQMAAEHKKTNPERRMSKSNESFGGIDSNIITFKHAEIITKWIDNLEITDELTSSYEFKLLISGSRDGFSPEKFHKICDNKARTLTIVKVKGGNEIIGGYNPVVWKSKSSYGTASNSFIFSFKNDDCILSRVKNERSAILNNSSYGPSFGNGDLVLSGNNSYSGCCKRGSYEKSIRGTGDTFSVEDYEVYQISEDSCSIF
ncbi:uncharacterized protein OCT59_021046 [Rhizophagus irregularis]|uniref:Kelch-like protein 17 n=4 Tax=Rhizophagus irregularis TaxID=588596 RepID=A0A015IX62_RHIIW|nr:hypothetical protein GLOIN_2v1684125 [Rhizophagus irregularis DAOM 181602=DAOM 197198]EXX58925.1 hypothetical protein RirG_193360 [Rhizophagus irregularis DAOM 197198w]POG63669.1 hypothetical protein GLOIN_2v1684125 [Rhizophagus irregularis DAOM 181602=DAOM 197198]UZO02567.1 hypothetical protein OCT59_021046 [Rhizophagus irregularis]|eukprot:XP_025170535.1 hypothetical protein GLOIN_2v1684125 [Rhizophagus irregularis DAOM 181602=DAOM 197198]